jgi:hypothetical protein
MGWLLGAEISAVGAGEAAERISTEGAQESQKSKVSRFQGFMVSRFQGFG